MIKLSQERSLPVKLGRVLLTMILLKARNVFNHFFFKLRVRRGSLNSLTNLFKCI